MNNTMVTRRLLLGMGAALGVSACMPSMVRQPGADDAFKWTLSPPESAGLSADGLQAVRAVIRQYIDSHQITGAVAAIARNNHLVFYEAMGERDPQAGTPMRKDDLFCMMSSTKVVTAVAAMMMVEEGKLSIDDKVSRFIPAFRDARVVEGDADNFRLVPAHREVTIKDLLTHTSGLSSGGLPANVGEGLDLKPVERKPDDTLASYLSRFGPVVLEFQPGTRWGYSPADAFDIILRVVEIVSGQPADVFMRERLFEPLDMRDSWFHVPASERHRVMPLYVREDDAWRRSEAVPLVDKLPNYTSGAGNLYSTAHDFLNFELMLLNQGALNGRRVLNPESVALMSQNHIGPLFADAFPVWTAGFGFGLGGRVVLDAEKVSGLGVGAFGWGGAYGTESWIDPRLGIAAAIMVQQPVRSLAPDVQKALRHAIEA